MQGAARVRWLSGRALLGHLGALVAASGCMFAFWWQLRRALGGNTLSWAYTFEWPFFAGFAVVVWWQFLHDDPETVGSRGLKRILAASEPAGDGPSEAAGGPVPGPGVPPDWTLDDGDPDRAAYNRYLAGLARSGRRKTWRTP